MQVPAILQGKRPFDLIKGGIAGAILITAVGFNWTGYGFGWMLRGTDGGIQEGSGHVN
jgi:hypothetical protein